MENIKEVKKICPRCKGIGKIIWHDRQSGAEFKGTDIESPCPDCQLFPQPLDDKELREKARLTDEELNEIQQEGGIQHSYLKRQVADKALAKALALLLPKIEEAIRQERERITGSLKEHERIGLELEGLPNHITFTMPIELWQALGKSE